MAMAVIGERPRCNKITSSGMVSYEFNEHGLRALLEFSLKQYAQHSPDGFFKDKAVREIVKIVGMMEDVASIVPGHSNFGNVEIWRTFKDAKLGESRYSETGQPVTLKGWITLAMAHFDALCVDGAAYDPAIHRKPAQRISRKQVLEPRVLGFMPPSNQFLRTDHETPLSNPIEKQLLTSLLASMKEHEQAHGKKNAFESEIGYGADLALFTKGQHAPYQISATLHLMLILLQEPQYASMRAQLINDFAEALIATGNAASSFILDLLEAENRLPAAQANGRYNIKACQAAFRERVQEIANETAEYVGPIIPALPTIAEMPSKAAGAGGTGARKGLAEEQRQNIMARWRSYYGLGESTVLVPTRSNSEAGAGGAYYAPEAENILTPLEREVAAGTLPFFANAGGGIHRDGPDDSDDNSTDSGYSSS